MIFNIGNNIIIALTLLTTINSTLSYVDPRCEALFSSNNCYCSTIFKEYEINCPEVEPKIKIRLELNSSAIITCENISQNVFDILPLMNIGALQKVKFDKCPLPHGKSIQTIFKRLGIIKVTEIIFHSGDVNSIPMRVNFEGLDDVEKLHFKSYGLLKLPDDAFVGLKNLKRLDCRSNNLTLSPTTFANLKNIEYLELGNNNLQDLPDGVFEHLNRLTILNIFSNKLKILTKNTFKGASTVSALDLSANKIEDFPSDVFSILTNLTNINLNANYFKSLPVGLFAKNEKLEYFRLTNNRVPLNNLPSGLLSDLPYLKEVQLTCDLKTLASDLFTNSSRISNITINYNQLTTLPEGLFHDQTNLLDLNLESNRLTHLPDSIFANTRQLIKLSLSHNQLVNISEQIFSYLTNLEVLYLNDNQLMNIHWEAFVTPTKLHYIDLMNNYLNFNSAFVRIIDNESQELNSPFQRLTELRTLLLRNNSITRIYYDWMMNLLELEVIDLSYNNLSILSDSDLQFQSKKNVMVNLTNNQISEIYFNNIDIYEFTDSKNIDLNNNPLMCDCGLMWFVQYLKGEIGKKIKSKLNINVDSLQCAGPELLKNKMVADLKPCQLHCSLDTIDSTVKYCPKECTCFIRTCDKALIVNCSNSRLSSVPTLPRVTELKLNFTELYIENNNIKKLPGSIEPGYSDVLKLYAANNNLTQINSDSLPANLKILDLKKNNLGFINMSFVNVLNHSFHRIESLQLSSNPWICDCTTVSMLAYFQENYKTISDYEHVKCLSGLKISEIKPGEFCAVEKGLVIAMSVLIAMFGLFVGTLAALYYKYQKEIKVWLFAHNMCLWFVTEQELDKDKKYDAFISYSHKDEDFIADHLVPELENGPKPFKLCLHIRDWIVGEFIQNQIVRSVEESRRTIVILSPSFIESIWGRMEFRAAHTAALNEGRARVIVVIYGDIGNVECLDPELKAYLKMNTYVKWGDPWFWDKLRYAMPHSNHLPAKGMTKTLLKSSTDDKLDLIEPSPITPPLTTPPADQIEKNSIFSKLNSSIINNSSNQQNQPQAHRNGNLINGINGHINNAFLINTNAKQSDV